MVKGHERQWLQQDMSIDEARAMCMPKAKAVQKQGNVRTMVRAKKRHWQWLGMSNRRGKSNIKDRDLFQGQGKSKGTVQEQANRLGKSMLLAKQFVMTMTG